MPVVSANAKYFPFGERAAPSTGVSDRFAVSRRWDVPGFARQGGRTKCKPARVPTTTYSCYSDAQPPLVSAKVRNESRAWNCFAKRRRCRFLVGTLNCRCRFAPRRRGIDHRSNESVSATSHRFDKTRRIGRVTQCIPQAANSGIEAVVKIDKGISPATTCSATPRE